MFKKKFRKIVMSGLIMFGFLPHHGLIYAGENSISTADSQKDVDSLIKHVLDSDKYSDEYKELFKQSIELLKENEHYRLTHKILCGKDISSYSKLQKYMKKIDFTKADSDAKKLAFNMVPYLYNIYIVAKNDDIFKEYCTKNKIENIDEEAFAFALSFIGKYTLDLDRPSSIKVHSYHSFIDSFLDWFGYDYDDNDTFGRLKLNYCGYFNWWGSCTDSNLTCSWGVKGYKYRLRFEVCMSNICKGISISNFKIIGIERDTQPNKKRQVFDIS